VQYEQPNFPVPANPSLEFDEGYAASSDNFGPTGSATASALYPGQVVANAGPELALLVPGVPLPPAPVAAGRPARAARARGRRSPRPGPGRAPRRWPNRSGRNCPTTRHTPRRTPATGWPGPGSWAARTAP